MTYPTFFDPGLDPGAAVHELTGEEARHAVAVRRIRPGEEIEVVDGRGTRIGGPVQHAEANRLQLAVTRAESEPTPAVQLILVQALAKGGRDEAAIEAATEVGADAIIAWQSARSIARWRQEKVTKGLTRWRSVVLAAMKQSRRSHRPDLLGFARGEQVLDLLPAGAHVLILHETAAAPLAEVDLPTRGTIVVVVGPEGGLTQEEVQYLSAHGGQAVRLGREVLRTSSAGPAALAVLNTRLRRW